MGLAGGAMLLLAGALQGPLANPSEAVAGVSAEIVSPAVTSVAAAAELLLGSSPGVLTLRIPGAGPAATIALTATAVEGSSGGIIFNAPRESAGALQQLVAEVSAAVESATLGSGPAGVVTTGVIKGQGVQVVVTKASQGSDGGGTVTAIISYD